MVVAGGKGAGGGGNWVGGGGERGRSACHCEMGWRGSWFTVQVNIQGKGGR